MIGASVYISLSLLCTGILGSLRPVGWDAAGMPQSRRDWVRLNGDRPHSSPEIPLPRGLRRMRILSILLSIVAAAMLGFSIYQFVKE